VNLNEDQIRQLVIQGIRELGDGAGPDALKKYVEEQIASSAAAPAPAGQKTGERIILTSFGMNHPGVVSSISTLLSTRDCDILDLSQKIMQEFYTMIMLVDIANCPVTIKELQEEMNALAGSLKIKIYLQHEDVFRFMHRI
jgi:ACT domain-containing protein